MAKKAWRVQPGLCGKFSAFPVLLFVFRGNRAAALAFAGILPGATVIAGLTAALAFAGVLAFAIVLRSLRFLLIGFCVVVLSFQCGAGRESSNHGAECESKFSTVHVFSLLEGF